MGVPTGDRFRKLLENSWWHKQSSETCIYAAHYALSLDKVVTDSIDVFMVMMFSIAFQIGWHYYRHS